MQKQKTELVQCQLCQFKGKNLVKHYYSKHNINNLSELGYKCIDRDTSWNLGIPMSKEAKEKERKAHIGIKNPKASQTKKNNPESIKQAIKNLGDWIGKSGVDSPTFGIPKTKEHRKKLSIAKKGKPLPHTVAWDENIGLAHIGLKHTKATRKKISISKKKLWDDIIFATKSLEAFKKKPTQDEMYLDGIIQLNFPKEFIYNGEGKNLRISRKMPDFIHTKKKLLIEYDGYYTHRTKKGIIRDFERNKIYKEAGYKLLVISKEDLKNQNVLIKKINTFLINN